MLFPYVKSNIESYLNKNFENADLQKAVAALRDQVNTGSTILIIRSSSYIIVQKYLFF